MAKKVNVGLVGYKFMGQAHSNAYSDVAMFFDMDAEPVMKAICGRNEEGVKVGEARYRKDKQHGMWYIWDDSGTLRYEMEYKKGKKTGTWIVYDESGSQVKQTTF